MSEKLPLTFAVAEAPHTSAIRNGQISIAGVDGEFLTIHPQIAAFRRMVRDVEFDVCELAAGAAFEVFLTDLGEADWTVLPVVGT